MDKVIDRFAPELDAGDDWMSQAEVMAELRVCRDTVNALRKRADKPLPEYRPYRDHRRLAFKRSDVLKFVASCWHPVSK